MVLSATITTIALILFFIYLTWIRLLLYFFEKLPRQIDLDIKYSSKAAENLLDKDKTVVDKLKNTSSKFTFANDSENNTAIHDYEPPSPTISNSQMSDTLMTKSIKYIR